MADNLLYYGDNLDVLRRHVRDESVDLVYLDPPFNSNATYNVLFGERDGSRAAAQIKVFEDTWTWDEGSAAAFEGVVEAGGDVSRAMQAFHTFLGPSTLLAYLAMMAPRLAELRRVLKPTGSIYLHCDPTASHYLKMLMDAVFGVKNFRNDIIWHYCGWNKKLNTYFERRSDNLLFYAKGQTQIFRSYAEPWKSTEEYVKVRKQKVCHDEDGRAYVLSDRGKGQRIRRWLDEAMQYGRPIDNVWDIGKLNNSSAENLGYPTQKPEALLERIIKASSSEGSCVLDPFCGCGTTVAVAQKLNRRWIGIDITHLAITLIRHRLQDAFEDQVDCRVVGEPVALAGAEALAKDDPYQFQWWALGLVGARPNEQKKGADKGIDGRIYFHDDSKGKTKQIVFSVKAGHVSVAHLRDLRGVVDREQAAIGVLITMQNPTKPMRTEAASAGFYQPETLGQKKRYPRLQILTVAELLDGKRIDYPSAYKVDVTFKKAPKAEHKEGRTRGLFDEQDS